MMPTLRSLWADTAAQLGNRHEARWLWEVATNLDGADFDAQLDEPVTQRMVAHHDSMFGRYQAGEPLQYVLGRWAFRHLDLMVDQRVLIPRPETEKVAERALACARNTPAPRRIADLGTGSGAIGLSLASELPLGSTTVVLTDASTDALDVARANLAGIGRSAAQVTLVHGSWFEPLVDAAPFDVIVTNPPYIATGSPDIDASVDDWEPHCALYAGTDGLDDIRLLVAGAPQHLTAQGWLIIEIGADQGPAVAALLNEHQYRQVAIDPDLAGLDRIAIGQRPETPPVGVSD